MDAPLHHISQWKIIRLELARTPEFPAGSPSRAYVLRLPLDEEGLIDEDKLGQRPAMATVRRFWPNEPDQQGYVIRVGGQWAFTYAGGEDDERLVHLETHPLVPGECLSITEPDGREYPFEVAAIQS